MIEVIVNQQGDIEVIPQQLPIIEVNLNPVPINGKSAYQVAVYNGFIGSEQEWLDSLKLKEWNSTNW